MSDAIELDRVTRKAEEPAKAWRNKYRWADTRCVVWGWAIAPSKEIAAQFAAEYQAEHPGVTIYLGAFPVPA